MSDDMKLPEELADRPIVTVYTSSREHEGGAVLREPVIQEIAGRVFLMGFAADTGHKENWMAGKMALIAWDSITSMVAMTDDEMQSMWGKTFGRKRQ